MKKIMMTLATLFVAVCASAQVYIGGGFSLANTSVYDDSYFSWKYSSGDWFLASTRSGMQVFL